MSRKKLFMTLVLGAALVFSFLGCGKKGDAGLPRSKTKTPTSTAGRPRLNLSFVPVMNIEEMVKQFSGVSDYLSAELGMEVSLIPTHDYGDMLKKLKSKEIDVGTAGSYVAYRAIRELGAIPLARPEKGGISTYKGVIVARKDSGISKVEELKGKTFAYVDPNTYAGYVYPRALLKEKGFDPDSFFGRTAFAGKHDAAFLQVFHRQADGVAAKDIVFWQLAAQNPDFKKEMLILAESNPVPEKTLVARSDLDPKLVYRIREALLGMHANRVGQEALTKFGADRFVLTEIEDFSEIDRLEAILNRP